VPVNGIVLNPFISSTAEAQKKLPAQCISVDLALIAM
jgi:hypothetical protein